MNERELTTALALRYAPPEFAFLPQLRNGTGYQTRKTRTADGIAMGLYPSRGLTLHGFEIKCSRSDWLTELKNPDKAEELCRYCDRWWVVAGDTKVVKDGELPPTWGLLVPRGDKLVVKVDAPQLQPQPLTKVFFAALMRKAQLVVSPQAEIDRQIKLAVDDALEAERIREAGNREYEAKQYQREYEQLLKSVEDFERESGVKIGRWDGGQIGEIVGMLRRCGVRGVKDDLQNLRKLTERITNRIDEQLTYLDKQEESVAEATA